MDGTPLAPGVSTALHASAAVPQIIPRTPVPSVPATSVPVSPIHQPEFSQTPAQPYIPELNSGDLEELDELEHTEPTAVPRSQSDSSEDLSGRILNNTYRLEKKIGHGGMGAVYKATHLKIGDSVAIKFIAEDLASNPRIVARFQREALAARRIAHPDAVAVYEMSETTDGLIFIVMQYVEGEGFDQYLQRSFPFTGRRILHFLRCIADVLDAAHRAGIVHRDLKPSNLMLYTNSRGEERVKVLDFGIAKLINIEDEELGRLTQKGDVFGSPYFMSPEQAMGSSVDARADIYSLGVLGYQMITGKLPFEGKSGREVLDKLLSKEPQPPSQVIDTDIDYDPAILKALAKDPEKRQKNVLEFIADVEIAFSSLSDAQWRFTNVSGALPPSGIGYGAGNQSVFNVQIPSMAEPEAKFSRSGPLSERLLDSLNDRISIAILPLKCLSADEQTRILSVGLADTLITELGIVRDLIVRPIRAVLKYENTDVDPMVAGQMLGVDFILDGSMQSFGQRVRVSFRLIDINHGQDIWRDRFELLGEDPFIIQDRIARRIVESLRINLTDYEKEQFAHVPQSVSDAQQYYIRGRHILERAIEPNDLDVALQMFNKAIEIDPLFARAYTALAQCHYFIKTGFDDCTDHLIIAEEFCQKAMQLDASLADAYATLASIYMDMGKRNEVLELISKALLLSPNNLEADLCLGWYYRSIGQLEKSIAAYKRALREDPTFWRCYWGICMASIYQGRYDDAEKAIDAYLKSIDSRHPVILFLKGQVLIYKNNITEGESLGNRMKRTLPDLPCGDLLLAHVYATRKDTKKVVAHMNNINRRFGPQDDLFYWYTQIYSRCGLLGNAIEYLKKAIATGNHNFEWFSRDPALEALRATPAFTHLVTINKQNIGA